MQYDAVLLDIDGTLVDSNAAHAAAWSEAFAQFGRDYPSAMIRPLIGKGGDKLLLEIASLDAESAEGQKISEARTEIFKRRYLPGLKPTRGAAAFVAWLLDRGLRVHVATSATQDEVRALLEICRAEALAPQATTSDDAARSKPDPDIVAAALKKSGAPPQRALMIGDTPYDVEAAVRAGVHAIALRCGGWDDRHLQGSTAIYADPQDLLDHAVDWIR
ncbi:MAG TPA: HAD family hydrolase [Gemmatimonadaceae bacterium]|nr:HAD family hydrolase [Gemmatimonadaceae bacterium]